MIADLISLKWFNACGSDKLESYFLVSEEMRSKMCVCCSDWHLSKFLLIALRLLESFASFVATSGAFSILRDQTF